MGNISNLHGKNMGSTQEIGQITLAPMCARDFLFCVAFDDDFFGDTWLGRRST
jgi:hypothetical protein